MACDVYLWFVIQNRILQNRKSRTFSTWILFEARILSIPTKSCMDTYIGRGGWPVVTVPFPDRYYIDTCTDRNGGVPRFLWPKCRRSKERLWFPSRYWRFRCYYHFARLGDPAVYYYRRDKYYWNTFRDSSMVVLTLWYHSMRLRCFPLLPLPSNTLHSKYTSSPVLILLGSNVCPKLNLTIGGSVKLMFIIKYYPYIFLILKTVFYWVCSTRTFDSWLFINRYDVWIIGK